MTTRQESACSDVPGMGEVEKSSKSTWEKALNAVHNAVEHRILDQSRTAMLEGTIKKHVEK